MKIISLTLVALLSITQLTQAQWTTSGSDIYNTNSGNVGIGTTTPTEKLDVIGIIKATSFNVKGATAVEIAGLTGTGMGYSPTSYPAVAVGILSGTGVTSIGYNPLTNTGGNFAGDGSEVLFRNIVKFIQPNAGGTDYLSSTLTMNNGNVGIGTTSPTFKLDVLAGNDNQVFLDNAGSQYTSMYFANNGTKKGQVFYDNTNSYLGVGGAATGTGTRFFYGAGTLAMTIDGSSGNVGIGTMTPGSLVDLYALAPAVKLSPSSYGGTNYSTYLGSLQTAVGMLQLGNNGQNDIVAGNTNTGGFFRFIVNNSNTFPSAANGTIAMLINPAGNVGIGTTTPGSFKLAVNGNVHAQQVNVDLIGWSDYVFKRSYVLPSLAKVKTYIDQNHRLPDMPSEQQIIKDGLNLGEMNKLLAKKVEELTLYLIEQDAKENNQEIINSQLADKLKAQQAEINALNQKVNTLLNKITHNQ
ncbi:MAG: hypothetical protein JWP94_1683 [Mucilaginibacter sp.]|jgi:hypothetical protein|nr:hypothetical protein [Mucilaginibacter sp.]